MQAGNESNKEEGNYQSDENSFESSSEEEFNDESPMCEAVSPTCDEVPSSLGSPCARQKSSKKPHDAPRKNKSFGKLLVRRATIVPFVLDEGLQDVDLPKSTILQSGKNHVRASSKAHYKNISKMRLDRDHK
jgi:hypothetical protein